MKDPWKKDKSITIAKTSFGDIYNFPIPKGYDCIILASNEGGGLKAFQLCLPHHVYVDKIDKYLKEHPEVKQITIIPINSEDYINLIDWKGRT